MIRPVFITGTGTDIGKTHVLAAVLAEAHRRGLSASVLKPVLSGFDAADLPASDSGRLLAALDRPVTPETVAEITPWRFAAPLSPDLAATREGVTLRLDEIADDCADPIACAAGPVFVEGAGGVMSPIAADGLNLDLIRRLHARPVLVCGAYLGALSHTLTAVTAMRSAGAPPELIVLNPHPPGPSPAADLAAVLGRHTEVPVLIWEDAAAGAVLDALKLA